ncbi:MAG: hypothetical protein SFW36_19640, partial [Leptolyngbyaceae cyanobacterium bins.59]|nr:hypothetical protein [Leptolyngbyaceae cyanobacterium bins.59]
NPVPASFPFFTPIGAVAASAILAALTEGQFLWAVILAGTVLGGIGANILQATLTPLTDSFSLDLDRTHFKIKRLRSGKVINRAQGKIKDIESFSASKTSDRQGAIVIQTRQGPYTLEGKLTESEARWAVKRIQGWLGNG